jgi:hypothetical protein
MVLVITEEFDPFLAVSLIWLVYKLPAANTLNVKKSVKSADV